MKKAFVLNIIVCLAILLSTAAFSQQEPAVTVQEDSVITVQGDADPQYGASVESQLIADAMAAIDSLAGNSENTADMLALKKKVTEFSGLVIKNNDVRAVPESRKKKLSAVYGEISNLLSSRKAPADNDKISLIKAKIDAAAAGAGNFDSCNGLTNDALKQKLHELIKDHKQLGYDALARKVMFSQLDNVGGQVRCVYTGRMVQCNSVPSANPPQAMNTEHTWPKSLGAKNEPAKSDLNHLFPTDTFANSTRSDFPFGMVKRGAEVWSQGGSAFDGDVFMPREDQRGRTARAIFYFSICYQLPIFGDMEPVLREWHKQYPPNDEDRARNEGIFGFQGNRNPFIDRPDLVDKIDKF